MILDPHKKRFVIVAVMADVEIPSLHSTQGENSMYGSAIVFVAISLAVNAAAPSWDTWGEWGAECSKCSGAVSRGRSRVCIPGDDLSLCSGSRLEKELCPDCTAEWTEWFIGTECSDTCGLCGRFTRTRECASPAGCPTPPPTACVGNSTDQNTPPCDGGDICLFPKPNCCMGVKTADTGSKRFHCKIE
ncbi:unnamed protein product [Cylicocyclus nassatus]|uniref:Uncharacterized protein n=1 Tax=Cylicocyclus nassatus TaxID=53992 RepID=A0AA36ME73_CYLNA|nr:unnamed protein product [Cylicocyclus nassatus]